jgi:3-(3-hydroxy-phenyl)propionate hydroxylase
VSYWADPQCWHFLLRIVGAWRVMLPVAPEVPDDEARSLAYAQRSLASVLPQGADAPIDHVAMYRAHQRVAATFRLGRVFLAGDAAHINNPLGGLGMNGGLHDALNLTERLGAVIHARCGQDALEGYDRQRRRVTTSAIQNEAIRNKTNLEARTVEVRRIFREGLQAAAADRAATRAFLRRISMIDSLEHAAAL